MQLTFTILTIVFVLVSLALGLIVLVQRPQGGGLSGAFGGGGGTDTAFGGRTGDALTVATITAFTIYLLVAIGLNITSNVMISRAAEPASNTGTARRPIRRPRRLPRPRTQTSRSASRRSRRRSCSAPRRPRRIQRARSRSPRSPMARRRCLRESRARPLPLPRLRPHLLPRLPPHLPPHLLPRRSRRQGSEPVNPAKSLR